MSIVIDRSRCAGVGNWEALAPDLVQIDDDGVTEGRRRSRWAGFVRRARRGAVPENVLRVYEDIDEDKSPATDEPKDGAE